MNLSQAPTPLPNSQHPLPLPVRWGARVCARATDHLSAKGSPKTRSRETMEQDRNIHDPDLSRALERGARPRPPSPVRCPQAHRGAYRCTALARPARHTQLTQHVPGTTVGAQSTLGEFPDTRVPRDAGKLSADIQIHPDTHSKRALCPAPLLHLGACLSPGQGGHPSLPGDGGGHGVFEAPQTSAKLRRESPRGSGALNQWLAPGRGGLRGLCSPEPKELRFGAV